MYTYCVAHATEFTVSNNIITSATHLVTNYKSNIGTSD